MNRSKQISKNSEFFKITGRYLKQEWKIASILVLVILTFCLTRISIPLLTQQITLSIKAQYSLTHPEYVFSMAENDLWWHLTPIQNIAIAISMIILDGIGCFIFNICCYVFGLRVEVDLRNKLLEKLVRQDISYYSDRKIGEILTKVVSDTQIIGESTVRIPANFGISISQFIVAIVMTFVLSWQIAIVGLLVFSVIMVLYVLFYRKTVAQYAVARQVYEEVNGNVTDRIGAIRLIKASGTEDYEQSYFAAQQAKNYTAHKPAILNLSFLITTIYAGSVVMQLLVPVFAGLFLSSHVISYDAHYFFSNVLPSYMISQASLVSTLEGLMGISFSLAMAGVASGNASDVLNATSRMNPHYYDGIVVKSIQGDIVFDNVEFRYPEKPGKVILPQFSFTFKAGQSYAFVGETGSGKSTIARLLLRFYDPSSGAVIINQHQNLKDVNLTSYLQHVGYVEQEPQILFGDVFENVKYGKFDATDEQVIAACKQAEIHHLIASWPEGYHTILGERGFLLSGGQKQRLIIARLILKNPEILILDEATSALDNIVEKEIQAKLYDLMHNRTSITIAHRLSTIKHVDHVIVLGGNGAGIVQQGTFQELVNQPGHFKNLYDAGLLEQL